MKEIYGTCTNCKDACEVVVMDFGIGGYEYWGAKGNDIQLEAVSTCCEAPAVDWAGNTITLSAFDNEPEQAEEDDK